jgi:hypothetical protein
LAASLPTVVVLPDPLTRRRERRRAFPRHGERLRDRGEDLLHFAATTAFTSSGVIDLS